VVTGRPYAGLARYTAGAKSLLTCGIGETRCEGPFGIALKSSAAGMPAAIAVPSCEVKRAAVYQRRRPEWTAGLQSCGT